MGIRYREEIIELESDEKKKETKFKEKIKMKEIPRVTQGRLPSIKIEEVNGTYWGIKNYI